MSYVLGCFSVFTLIPDPGSPRGGVIGAMVSPQARIKNKKIIAYCHEQNNIITVRFIEYSGHV